MVSRRLTLFFFFFFGFGRSSLDRNGSGMVVQSYFLLIFSLNPFIKFYLSWPENGSATLSFTAGLQAGTELQRC